MRQRRQNSPVRRGVATALVACVSALVVASTASAQVSPLRACALVDRPIKLRIDAATADAESSAETQETLLLISASTGAVLESRPVAAGEIDAAQVFPRLWKTDQPQVVFIQAALDAKGEKRVGPATVLVPMLTPRYASHTDRAGVPVLTPPPKQRIFSGYWTFKDQHALVKTIKGDLEFALRADAAPNSVLEFRDLVSKGFYSGIAIHRIASLSGQTLPDIVQFGDPTGTGQGGPGFMFDFEPSTLKHAYGTLSFARTSDPNSAGSQVIIALNRENTAFLDGRYTTFAQLVSGAEVLTTIAKTPADADGRPKEAVTIESITLVDAPPRGSEPKPATDPLQKKPER